MEIYMFLENLIDIFNCWNMKASDV